MAETTTNHLKEHLPVGRKRELLVVAGQEVSISNPDKLYFREAGVTKLELVHYYLGVADPGTNSSLAASCLAWSSSSTRAWCIRSRPE